MLNVTPVLYVSVCCSLSVSVQSAAYSDVMTFLPM